LTSTDARRVVRRRFARLAGVVAIALAPILGGAGAATAAAPPPSGERPTWVLPQGGDLLAGFIRSDYNERDGRPEQIASPDVPGQQALQFTVEGDGERSELRPRIGDQVEGNVQYYSYSAGLAPDFPTDASTWQLLLQWHQYGSSGSPPVAVEVRQNRVMLSAEGKDMQDLGPVRGGDRVDLTMRIAFSRDSERGTVDVWRSGEHVLRGYHPPGGTMFDGGDYMKVGIYRDTSIKETGRLWIDDLRIGPTLGSVQSEESASGVIAAEDNAAGSGPVGTPMGLSANVATWVAGGLLVVLLLLTVSSVRPHRRVHR